MSHVSVLKDEVVAALQPERGAYFIDATVGLGGHSEAILDAARPEARLLGVDRDPEALERARERLRRFGDRVRLVEASFSELPSLAEGEADGLVADLGVSSLQLDTPERGFSFRAAAPIDMRMGPSIGESAAALLAGIEVEALAEILREYGEVPSARRVAKLILEARDAGQLGSTLDLARAVERAIPPRRHSIHPATLVFQALRIATNRELDELDALLEALPSLLAPGGRAAIISFHSLEDRRVKREFAPATVEGLPRGLPVEPTPKAMVPVGKRAITASDEELAHNPRARSARLRVAERRAR